MTRTTILLAILVWCWLWASHAVAAKPAKAFELYAWLEKMPGKPADIAALPMPRMLDARHFFDALEGGGYSQEVNEAKVIEWAKNHEALTPSRLIVVDIEHLPHTSFDPQTRLDALAKIGHVIDLCVDARPLNSWALSRGVRLPKTVERRADAIAEAIWGEPILYDRKLYVQNTLRGTTPRPKHLGL